MLANRIIEWTLIHQRRAIALKSLPLSLFISVIFSYFTQLLLLLHLIYVLTVRLCGLPLLAAKLLFLISQSVFISDCGSLFSKKSSCIWSIILHQLLSLLRSSLQRHPKAFIFPPFLIDSVFFSPAFPPIILPSLQLPLHSRLYLPYKTHQCCFCAFKTTNFKQMFSHCQLLKFLSSEFRVCFH